LLVLMICARKSTTLLTSILAVALGTAAAAATLPLEALRAISGTASQRGWQGLGLLFVLLALSAVAVFAQRRIGALEPSPLGRAVTGLLIAGVTVCVIGGFVLTAGGSTQSQNGLPAQTGAKATRLASVQSSRGAYWKVAAESFSSNPVLGEGPASFRVAWLRERPFPEAAKDAHSLYLETAAELGLVGLLALVLAFAGAIQSSLRALAIDRRAAAGPVALLATWALHAGLDWDWEMPAVTLVALAAAGYLAALSAQTRS
ncbi:MAG: hypothetical protein F2813_09055, partial [Actinobacteria bacterium]|nr:hypothetical protein [Actinomycetota bacterium]